MSRPGPTSNGSNGDASGHAPRRRPGAEFMVKNKFKSTLPALPFDPKSLQYPFPPDLLAKYHLSSLEKYAQYALPFPEVPVDLLNLGILDADNFESVPRRRPNTYPVDPKDDPLLVDPDSLGESGLSRMRITNQPGASTSAGGDASRAPGAMPRSGPTTGAGASNAARPVPLVEQGTPVVPLADVSKDAQVAVIQSSFAATQSRVQLGPGLLRHPTKPGVVAASITPVIPDLRLWPQFYAHVSTEEQIEIRPSEPGHVREPVLRAEQAGDDGRPILDLYVPRAGDTEGACTYVRTMPYEIGTLPDGSKIALVVDEEEGVAMYSAIRTRIMLGKSRAARSGTDMARKPPLVLVEVPETEESLQRAEDQYGTIGIDEVLVQKIRELPVDVPWTQALERLHA
ncbi:RNA polymerase-associated factor [Allomyces arbusculus]|nr:RNA polymerase-associated factor [Allomyces arbusculus]